MGRAMRAYRCHPWHGRTPLPQPLIGGWLHLSQVQISRLETGPARKHLDWLTFVARTLRIPAELLWFKLDDEESVGPPVAVPTMSPYPSRSSPTGLAEVIQFDDWRQRRQERARVAR